MRGNEMARHGLLLSMVQELLMFDGKRNVIRRSIRPEGPPAGRPALVGHLRRDISRPI